MVVMSDRKRTLEEMFGESLREMEILVIVFYGLSALIEPGGVSSENILSAAPGILDGVALWLIGAHRELKE